MKIDAAFVTGAVGRAGFPRDRLPELALAGRSNVGKSSLINALVRQRVARTSAAPGKTREANVYRIDGRPPGPFYLVDLPGYGYARGGDDAARAFQKLAGEYFGRQDGREDGQDRRDRQERHDGGAHPGRPVLQIAALLLVDSRHPGLESDLEAWRWLTANVERFDVIATKIDKLARGQRIRAMGQLESVFRHPVRPVSAATGEGMEDLWKLIDSLVNSPNRKPRRPPPRAATAPPSPTPRSPR